MREGEKILQARSLRKTLTGAEKRLWFYLRDRRLLNVKFRRQYAIGPYIADFACADVKLVVELDGSQHIGQVAYDKRRDAYIREQGFTILRFWNNDMLSQTEKVLNAIATAIEKSDIDSSPHPLAPRAPSPVNGRGENMVSYG